MSSFPVTAVRVLAAAEDVGGQEMLDHRAYVYTAGQITWDIRRPLAFLLKDRERVNIAAEIKQQRKGWEVWCGAIGLPWASSFYPCSRAWQNAQHAAQHDADLAVSLAGVDDRFIQDVPTVSTAFLVALFAWWAVAKRKQEQKTRAAQLLRSFISKLGSAAILHDLNTSAIVDDSAALCAEESRDGLCKHFDRWRLVAQQPNQASPMLGLSQELEAR